MKSTEVEVVLTEMLGSLATVVVQKKKNKTTFFTGEKVFSFTRKDGGVILKLPNALIEEYRKKRKASYLVMGKKQMKEWAVFRFENEKALRKDLPIFKKAIGFVSAGKT
ncbi:MAG: hypothetical protein JNM27_03395 [Leptospirales bacterium]|nr:hypothetical protein [Leptospirales bacterium]